MPPVYLVATISYNHGASSQTIRYLHSTPKEDADADCLAAELNSAMVSARYEVMAD